MYFIARNDDGSVFLLNDKPKKKKDGFWVNKTAINLPSTDNMFFRWWDGNPIEVELSEKNPDIIVPIYVTKDRDESYDLSKIGIFSEKPQRYKGRWCCDSCCSYIDGDESEFPDLTWYSKPLLFEGLTVPVWRNKKIERQFLYNIQNSFYGDFGLDSYDQLVAEIKKMQEERTGEVINQNIKSPFDRQPLSAEIVELLQQTYYGLLWMEKFCNPPMGTTLERAVGCIPALREEINTLISKNKQQDKDETQEQ